MRWIRNDSRMVIYECHSYEMRRVGRYEMSQCHTSIKIVVGLREICKEYRLDTG